MHWSPGPDRSQKNYLNTFFTIDFTLHKIRKWSGVKGLEETHLNVPTNPGQEWRQRFVPVVPQPFAVRSAGVGCSEENTITSQKNSINSKRQELIKAAGEQLKMNDGEWCELVFVLQFLCVDAPLTAHRWSCWSSPSNNSPHLYFCPFLGQVLLSESLQTESSVGLNLFENNWSNSHIDKNTLDIYRCLSAHC